MKKIQELLVNKRVGIISAHPDDHLIHVQAIQAADTTLRELTLTKGRSYARQPNAGCRDHAARLGRGAGRFLGPSEHVGRSRPVPNPAWRKLPMAATSRARRASGHPTSTWRPVIRYTK